MGSTLTAGISGREVAIGGLAGRARRSIEISVPDEVSPAQLEVAKRDLQIMLTALEKAPHGINAILAAGGKGDFAAARKAAEQYRLSEAGFVSQGGGFWIALAIGIAILLYSQDAY